MNTLCFTGWQQPADALAIIAPDAQHADYAAYDNVQNFFASLPRETDLAIGWSLGGQTLVRAIADGRLHAKHVILLAAPFQFLASDEYPQGMPREYWDGTVEGYRADPAGMLKQFCGVISAGDTRAASITRTLQQDISVWKNGLFWLEELGRFSCATLDFAGFPPTTIIQGESDKVVYPAQALIFAHAIPHAKVHKLEGCAHAPHLHDAAAIRDIIKQHV